jgi:hypothetical protein
MRERKSPQPWLLSGFIITEFLHDEILVMKRAGDEPLGKLFCEETSS